MPEQRIVDTTYTIDQLCLSPFNVRTDERDTSATEQLEASILERGLMQPINVHAMRGARAKWGAFAGGRRYRSIRNLVGRGDLPADWPIPVREYIGFTDAQLIEQSIAENMLRRDLREYELFDAVRKAHAKGDSVETIAAALGGQDPALVRRWLRMGELAPPVFAAFKADAISLEQARAYGATADHALQVAVFEQLQPLPEWEKTPDRIRAALKVNDAEARRMLRFVGDEAYRAAGGRFELDLFAGEAELRGIVRDEGLLRMLVDARLGERREDLRRRTGRPDLRFVPQPPQDNYGHDYSLRVEPASGEGDAIVLPEGDIVGWLRISDAGEPYVDWWWSSRSAKYGSDKPPRPPVPDRAAIAPGAAIGHQYDGARQKADAAIKEEAGLSQDAVQTFRSIRRTILRAILVTSAREGRTTALDYLIWAQLRIALCQQSGALLGMRGIQQGEYDFEPARPFVAATEASKVWGAAISELKGKRFLDEPDHVAAFIDYVDQPAEVKNLAAAVVAGIAIERSLNAPGYQVPVHDTLAAFARLSTDRSVRRFWSPTAELLGLLPKKEQLAIAEPLVEHQTFGAWSRLKAKDLPGQIATALTGAGLALRRSMQDAAVHWVHPLLRFTPGEGASPGDALAAQLEAAE